MTSLIKNQIIKHLSKFARNITADQISVQILSGKGELRNIDLNEIVLTEVLELPTWLRINRAKCNRVSVKIPWTRLKSSPVQLFVDEIHVEVQLTSEAPVQSGSNFLSFTDSSYGFANRVVEGMSLYVNTVEIHFDSGVFGGSLMLSRLSVESRSPGWQPVADLRYSRIIDPSVHQLLMFKQVTWQLLRIEASARKEPSSHTVINAPLRLITSNGKSRISVKKSTNDGAVLGGRIQVILDDILWVAALPQIRSAIAFYSHILRVIKAAPKKIGLSMQNVDGKTILSHKSTTNNAVSKAFRSFDFDQTSFHFYFGKIDLHLCDDTRDTSDYPADWDIDSGALQVTLSRISIDFYPANIANSDRMNWVRYAAPNPCSLWLDQILRFHFDRLYSNLEKTVQNRFIQMWPKLLSQNCVIKVYDVVVQCVTDLNTKKDKIFNLLMSDRSSKASLSSNDPLIHLEFASFYHPTTENMPLPANVSHLLLGPFLFFFDRRSLRWALYIYHDIAKALESSDASFDMQNIPRTEFRVDALMPKIVIPFDQPAVHDPRLPKRLVISVSTIIATNSEIFQIQNDSSFFNSLSSSVIDCVDNAYMPFDISSFRDFVILLNQSDLIGNIEGEERIWIKTSPVWMDTDRGECTSSYPLFGDVALHALVVASNSQVHVGLQPQSSLRVAVDHFQYIQLSRLLTSTSIFIDQLGNDQKFFHNMTTGNSFQIAIILLINQAIINLILPKGPMPSPYESPVNRKDYSTLSLDTSTRNDTSECSLNASYSVKSPICEERTRKDFENESFPEFPHPDSEVNNSVDETLSIATNISDDEQQFVVFETPEDDIFMDNEVALAEEAMEVSDSIDLVATRRIALSKRVNVLTAILNETNVIAGLMKGTLKFEGYSIKLEIDEKLDVTCGEIYNILSEPSFRKALETNTNKFNESELRFVFESVGTEKPPSLKADLRGVRINLHEEIVSHLSPFIIDDEKVDLPLNLKINILDTHLQIKDPKVAQPFRIMLNDCVIEQADWN